MVRVYHKYNEYKGDEGVKEKTLFYDVVIVGGGPAGTACALTLQQQGISHCIVDRAVFPRDKTCEGMLSAKTMALLKELIPAFDEEAFYHTVKGEQSRRFIVWYKEQILADLSLSRGLYITKRRVLDAYLLDACRKAGCPIFEGEMVVDVDFDERLVVTSNGRTIHYGMLVAADGVNSLVRHRAGLYDAKRAYRRAFTFAADVPREQITAVEKIPTGAVCAYLQGDAAIEWAVPHGTAHSLAVCFYGSKRRQRFPRERFDRFAVHMGVDPSKQTVHGAFFPSGSYLSRPFYRGQVLFVGDAAGYAEPLTGEGIYYALHSGRVAAQLLVQYGQTAWLPYGRRMRGVKRTLQRTNMFKTLFCIAPLRHLAIRVCEKNPAWMRRAFGNISADGCE